VGLSATDPLVLGHLEDGAPLRYSSISEPEEVFSSNRDREKTTKNFPKFRKQKSSSKFNTLGVPKCIQFVESVQEAVPRTRKRRHKGKGFQQKCKGAGSDGDIPFERGSREVSSEGVQGRACEQVRDQNSKYSGVTPKSGINLISGSDSGRSNSSIPIQVGEREKVIQAARLLSIQKEVGFNFEEHDEDTIKQLVEQEKCDRARKMEWEQREVDQ
jgi:hypothetical protein